MKIIRGTVLQVLIVFVTIMIFPMSVLAQHDNVGNWLMYFGQNRIADRLSIHSEVQYRNHTTASVDIEQLLLRGGLNYHFSPAAFATAGYARVFSHQYGSEQRSAEAKEHRVWQQLITTQTVGRIKFEHRYRVEQRWVNANYSTRLRYRLMLFVPINKPKIEPGALFIGVYDEIFVNTEKTFYDRNRLYAALGYQLYQNTSVQVGVLNQRVNDFGKWHWQFALVFNPDLRKKDYSNREGNE